MTVINYAAVPGLKSLTVIKGAALSGMKSLIVIRKAVASVKASFIVINCVIPPAAMTLTVINLVTFLEIMHCSRQQTRHFDCQETVLFLPAVSLLVRAETAVSYPSIVIKYVVFLKALQPHMGVIFLPRYLV